MAAQMHCQAHNPAQAWMAGMSSFSINVRQRHTVLVCLYVFLLGVALLGILNLAAIRFAWYLLLCYPVKAFAQE